MTVHTESLRLASFFPDVFHVGAPDSPVGHELWPRMPGVFIRKAAAAVAEPVEPVEPAETQEPQPSPPLVRELVVGQFGLVPRWVKSASDAKLRSPKLVNARSETVTTSNNLREAWLAGQRCIVPMMAFFEDDFRSGKAVPTRISRVDGQPMGVAGLWESWTGAGGETIVSYTLLTVNANSHALMHRYQQPGSEKRMPAVLNEGGYDAWLNAAHPEKAREFLRAYPANWLTANPVEKK
ncbi:SOS response-associated peptidase [Hydrogenophaga taeniospiralis]|jgi:putative SOS response-associated peptidase YedK|uniref:SOS response-associated peptidase n=1 Tax=Hydrogenophaga taeniospiralis TaxID=65656 RepID=UPI001CFA681C|nr:SOS response-associated peptidase family protein [Hydrogenophaga taeniospiralis]UCU92975.1 SOS response-associated peptidase [Hydrogenophaga taeniospiralis]